MQITYASEPGSPEYANEDLAVCGTGWALVLDGATAPDGVESGCIHDVPWLVSQLAAAITRGLLLGDADLRDVLAAAISATCEAHGGACDLSNSDSPSSTVSIIRVRGDSLDYLTLGDSPIVIRDPLGGITTILDEQVANLPGGRPYTLDLIRSHRNKPGGFWVASTNPGAARHSVAGTMPCTGDAEIGMFTDGVSRLVEFYGYEWDEVFAILEASGPAALISLVRSLELDRPLEHGKQHDDATALLAVDHPVALSARGRIRRPAGWRSLVGM